MASAALLSKNARTSSSLESHGVNAALHMPAPAPQPLLHSVSAPSLASTSTAAEVQRLASKQATICNPNSIIDKHPPYKNSKRGGLTRHEAEARLKLLDEIPQKSGLGYAPEPKVIIPRVQGRIHLNGPETVHSMVPLSIKGMRWDKKRRVYDKNGNRTYDLISGAYEQKELYGALRAFGGERSRTFSHKDLILPSNTSVQREIKEGVKSLEICDEWERKIMKTQGHIPKLMSFNAAFTLHLSSNPYNGNKFTWEYDAHQRRRQSQSGKEVIKSALNGGSSGGHLFSAKTGHGVDIPKLNLNQASPG